MDRLPIWESGRTYVGAVAPLLEGYRIQTVELGTKRSSSHHNFDTVLQLFLSPPKPALKFTATRTLAALALSKSDC